MWNSNEQHRISREYEEAFESMKWMEEIPEISFPSNWLVKITPPFAGAVVRFRVSKGGKTWVSVYLDCYDILGLVSSPYWEVYPYNEDVFRCKMNETDKLLDAIEFALNEQLNTIEIKQLDAPLMKELNSPEGEE